MAFGIAGWSGNPEIDEAAAGVRALAATDRSNLKGGQRTGGAPFARGGTHLARSVRLAHRGAHCGCASPSEAG